MHILYFRGVVVLDINLDTFSLFRGVVVLDIDLDIFLYFRGVVVLDIDLEKTSINQCDDSESMFSGSHKCRPETTKVSMF